MNKRVCDSIMAFVVDHGPGAMFGVNGVMNSFENKATSEDLAKALDFLITNKNLKFVGRYAFGLGTGAELNEYIFKDYSTDALYPLPSLEHLKAYHQLFSADYAKAPKKPKQPRTPKKPKVEKKAKQPAEASMDIPSFSGSVSIRGEVPKTVTEPDVFAEIDQLSLKLQSADIKDRELKCSVLMRLSKVMGPGISKVLSDIHADYEGKTL